MKDSTNETIPTSPVTSDHAPSAGPSIEESFEALKAEGLIDADGEISDVEIPTDDEKSGGETDQGSNDDRPDWLPEGFDSPEDFAKAYEELKNGKSDETTEETEEAEPTEAEKALEEQREQAETVLDKAGLKLTDVQAEFDKDGSLSEATYSALSAQGINKEMVDTYIKGVQSTQSDIANTNAVQAQVEQFAYAELGGEKAYDDMCVWAQNNLSNFEIDAYDNAVNSGNAKDAMAAVKGLKARYSATQSQEPDLTVTGDNTATDANVYSTQDEFMADLEDPRYDASEAFRNKVMAKVARSPNVSF